ncbi:MAG: hypothetical protein EKK46_11460 [Rhodocyclaceae bacterium]|nr:MAG: hypothetical protein EKK46_11460 [Rhodocyclaceae bacterium]
MKLHSDTSFGLNTVTGYGQGYVDVNKQRHTTSLILDPNSLEAPWPVKDVASLTAELLAPLATRRCDVVLLGTGQRQRFPAPAVLRPLLEAMSKARVGVEVMDTAAACRTYNILMAEGRNPVAALIVE